MAIATQILAQIHDNARVLAIAGRLDQDNCDQFRDELEPHLGESERTGQHIVFDLSQLEYVSSAGLRCFMLAARQAKSQKARIVVAALQPMVAEIFQISRFDLVLQVFPTVKDALSTLATLNGQSGTSSQ
jgi:anti-sigma B factor antagonist